MNTSNETRATKGSPLRNGASFALFLAVALVPHLVHAQTQRLTVRIVDAKTREPVAARIYLQSVDGKAYFFKCEDPEHQCVVYDKQNWINQDAVEAFTAAPAADVDCHLPNGRYRLTVCRGKTFHSNTEEFEVAGGDLQKTIAISKWNDPESRGWYSGDTHLHRTVDELKTIIQSEDLNVALPLTQWVTVSDTRPENGNRNSEMTKAELIEVDKSHVIWPLNTEYEIFAVGDKQHTLGALFVLGHQESIPRPVPPWKPVIEHGGESKANIIYDMDKLDWPFAILLPTVAQNALYELANNHVWRTEFAFREWNSNAPAYIIPPYGAKDGGHRQWLDYTMGMYYTLLNCGLELPPSAGTAHGVHPVPAGFGRVYVHLDGEFEFNAWMRGLKAGHSFVTTGPMLYASANEQLAGHRFERESGENSEIEIDLQVESDSPLLYGELIFNGRPIRLLRAENSKTERLSFLTQTKFNFEPPGSGWFAIRYWQPQPNGQSKFCHSAPWYVDVDGVPVRPRWEEKQFLIERMRKEIDRSQDIVAEPAMKEYREALEFYQSLEEYDETQEVADQARPLNEPTIEDWLDNMVLLHRFRPHEIRLATGMSIEAAKRHIKSKSSLEPNEVRERIGNPITLKMVPYPGGRHPRRGFLEGAVNPQRETKVSIFPPWENGGYAVVDLPEAIFTNLGLTYLAHSHIPTIWTEKNLTLPALEWHQTNDGLKLRRELPNGIAYTSIARIENDSVLMTVRLENGTTAQLSKIRMQVCLMLKGLIGFNDQDELESRVRGSLLAVRSHDTNRWLITGWTPLDRAWTNPPVPCIHVDPKLADCPAGESVSAYGIIRFYEGNEIDRELKQIETTLADLPTR